ncbi:hypothetical protein FKM82_025472 [Ascaphus truei]
MGAKLRPLFNTAISPSGIIIPEILITLWPSIMGRFFFSSVPRLLFERLVPLWSFLTPFDSSGHMMWMPRHVSYSGFHNLYSRHIYLYPRLWRRILYVGDFLHQKCPISLMFLQIFLEWIFLVLTFWIYLFYCYSGLLFDQIPGVQYFLMVEVSARRRLGDARSPYGPSRIFAVFLA